jgi:hypothetical protein
MNSFRSTPGAAVDAAVDNFALSRRKAWFVAPRVRYSSCGLPKAEQTISHRISERRRNSRRLSFEMIVD